MFKELSARWLAIAMMCISHKVERNKKHKYKAERDDGQQKLSVWADQVSIKNKFIGTLTHEMRNFVAAYV